MDSGIVYIPFAYVNPDGSYYTLETVKPVNIMNQLLRKVLVGIIILLFCCLAVVWVCKDKEKIPIQEEIPALEDSPLVPTPLMPTPEPEEPIVPDVPAITFPCKGVIAPGSTVYADSRGAKIRMGRLLMRSFDCDVLKEEEQGYYLIALNQRGFLRETYLVKKENVTLATLPKNEAIPNVRSNNCF